MKELETSWESIGTLSVHLMICFGNLAGIGEPHQPSRTPRLQSVITSIDILVSERKWERSSKGVYDAVVTYPLRNAPGRGWGQKAI